MKNITFNADAQTIELAREEARKRKNMLYQLFREWLEDLAARDQRRKNIRRAFEDLDACVTHIPKLSRVEMNER